MGSLDMIMKQIDKRFGAGSIMRMSDTPEGVRDVIPSGSLALDCALGIGGFPRGRMIEIYGPESSGKTTLAIHIMAEAMKLDEDVNCAMIDVEHAFIREYAENLGVDSERLLMSQPDSGEDAMNICEELIRSGEFAVVVIDSIAALVPQAEIDGDIGKSHVGLQARLVTQAMRKLTPLINESGTLLICINQLRANVNVMGYGPKENTPGGKGLKFFVSHRIDMRRIASLGPKDKEPIGNRVKITIKKNKMAAPFKKVEVDLLFGEGFAPINELVDLAVQFDIIHKAGSWYSYEDTTIGQGKEAAKLWLEDCPEYESIKRRVKQELGLYVEENGESV